MAEGFGRRARSALFGAAALGALVAIAGTGVAPTAPGRSRHVSVTVYEGTNFAVAASPDRRRIVIDMQNALWRLPFGGGRARKLTNNLTPATQPDFSPDGRTIFFQGAVRTMFAAPAGTSVAAPSWAPNGVRIAYTVSDLPAGPLAPSTSAA